MKMTKSKTKIESQLSKKTNPSLVRTIIDAKKNSAWIEVANILTGSRRKRKNFNVSDLEKTKGDVVICGKVLSQGEIKEKKKVIALSFSEKAKEKLKKAGCEMILISEEIKKNKDAKGVTILK
jgi:ribosomal protein L18E